ncbi:probable ATP-dependent DNA helicase HFM1 [Pectinophora gossypiella]|uniref:probable ATP-dependent DNA helicase HFM1 n=1 Tax=Pectinophora gossypiella TaxID=13191 RepID=UPI00214F1FDE|nr:probable ATP-dependent DNA helicase HFM1 [Pectinophora gossypiella]
MDLENFTDVLGDADEIFNSQPISLPSSPEPHYKEPPLEIVRPVEVSTKNVRPIKHTGQQGNFRSVEEIDEKYRDVFTYTFFNLVQSNVIEDAIYSDKSMVVCAPTGSGKTVVFEMAIVQLLMALDDKQYTGDFKIIYMAPVKALCTERLSEWYPKFTKLGLTCIEVTGDTNVDFSQLKPYRIIITTPEKWDMLTRRWRDHRGLVEVIKLFLIDEVHILNDECRGPVLEAVVSRMKTIESSSQAVHRIEQLQKQYQDNTNTQKDVQAVVEGPPRIRFVAVSATISNPEDVAAWLGTDDKPAVFYKFGDECRPVKLKRVVEGYPCPEGMSIFKFDIILNYKLWPIIQKYHNGKSTLIFCNTRKSVALTADTLSRELTINFTPEQKAKLTALASTIKNKKLQALVLSGVGCHHAGLLYEERLNIEQAFRNRDLPILITTTTLAMGVNLPAHLVIVKNTQQYVNGAYQEYSISTVLQMVGRAGRPQFDTEATAVIMTRLKDKPRYQALVGGSEPLQSYLHKRLAENLNSEAALGTVGDVAQCVQWLRSTFLSVRAAKDPRRYLGLPQNAPANLISKKIEELCVKAMNGLASSGLITMDEASCIESTEAGRLMSIFYLDLETMKHIMKIEGNESLERLLWIICESHELADMHLRVDERKTLNMLNRNNAAATIRFPMKGKINSRQMKLNCIIQAVLGCLPITDPSLNQEATKVMRTANRVCKCLVAYVTRPDIVTTQPQYYVAVLNSLVLAKCIEAHLWENSPYVSKQLKGIGPTFSTLLATAGKVNFTLLEESHPRDLERIINKGAPAGNVIRKQVGLLPKYQLTATPIDVNSVSIRLTLLNQHHLAENRDNLTAGDTHKCYVLVGDSENHLLLFTSFKDNDLISVYDGKITYKITRKHAFEHKIFIHCISSEWVGIDVQCDYEFKGLDPIFSRGEARKPIPPHQGSTKTNLKKQTMITDIYKERKRKSNDLDISQSKEKKKRDNSLIEKFKHLKNAFAATSKELKDDLQKTAQMSSKIINEMIQPENFSGFNIPEVAFEGYINSIPQTSSCNIDNYLDHDEVNNIVCKNYYSKTDTEDLTADESFIVDERIDSILNEIENQISKDVNRSSLTKETNRYSTSLKTTDQQMKNIQIQDKFLNENGPKKVNLEMLSSDSNLNRTSKLDIYKSNTRKRKAPRSNYSIIDLIAQKENNEEKVAANQHSGFSETIKNEIEKFLQKTSTKTNETDIAFKELLASSPPMENPSMEHNPNLKMINDGIETENNTHISPELPDVFIHDKIVKDVTEKGILNQKSDQPGDSIIPFPKNTERKSEDLEYIPEKDSCSIQVTDASDKQKLIGHEPIIDLCLENETCKRITNSKDLDLIDLCEAEKKEIIKDLEESKVENSNGVTNDRVILLSLPESQVKRLCKSISIEVPQYSNIHDRAICNRQEVEIDSFNKEASNILNLTNTSNNNSYQWISNKENSRLSEDYDVAQTEYETDCSNSRRDHNKNPASDFFPNENQVPEGYIKRYTFSTTKIDVQTKHTPDSQVRIITKLKLGMDVTEIVCTGDIINKKDSNRTNDLANIKKESSGMFNTACCSRAIEPEKDINRVKECKEHDTSLCSIENNDFDPSDIALTNPSHHTKYPTILSKKECKKIDTSLRCIEKNDLNPVSTALTSTMHHTDYPSLLKSINSIHLEDSSITETNTETRDSVNSVNNSDFETDTHEEKKNIKIENILQKYSTKLRKNNYLLNVANKSFYQHGTKHSPEKTRRSYKISDIHKLEVPLPKNLIEVSATRSSLLENAKIITRIQNLGKSIKPSNLTITPKIPALIQHTEVQNVDTEDHHQNKLDESMSYCCHSSAPEVPNLEADDCDIDQSMLNPKTLLQQCFSEDKREDILPPPVEFGDDIDYSPKEFQDVLDMELVSQNIDVTENNPDYIATDNDYNTSFFEDHGHSVLTASKDTETWILSQDENDGRYNQQNSEVNYEHNPIKPCTELVSLQKGIRFNSRKSKLGQFKFMNKSKLKM